MKTVSNTGAKSKLNNNTDQTAGEFLVILEQRLQDLSALSRLPKENPDGVNFPKYSQFRDMMGECLSFLIIIERRIDQIEDVRKDKLKQLFDNLEARIWSTLMEGSLSFLSVICEREYLPIGTRHVFVQEIKTLHDADKVLKQEKFQNILEESTLEQREKAELILNEIIDRAPELLNLGDPSNLVDEPHS